MKAAPRQKPTEQAKNQYIPEPETVCPEELKRLAVHDAVIRGKFYKSKDPICQEQPGEIEAVQSIINGFIAILLRDQSSTDVFDTDKLFLEGGVSLEMIRGTLLVRITDLLIKCWTEAAQQDLKAAHELINTLNRCITSLNEDAKKNPGSYKPVSQTVLKWPCLMNHASTERRHSKSPISLLHKLEVGTKHPSCKLRPKGGQFGSRIEAHYRIIAACRSSLHRNLPESIEASALPILIPEKLVVENWLQLSWKMFEREHGVDFFLTRDFAPFAIEPKRGSIKDNVRKKLRSAWMTQAKHVAKGATQAIFEE